MLSVLITIGNLLLVLSALGMIGVQLWMFAFRRVTRAAGLTPSLWNSVARGRLRGVDVEVRLEPARGGWATTIEVSGVPRDFRLTTLGAGTEVQRALVGRGLETGDSTFDDTFWLRGDERLMLAAFDHRTRGAVRRLTREVRELRLGAGSLCVRLWWRLPGKEELRGILDTLLELARPLASGAGQSAEVDARLFHNAFSDPNSRVRAKNLRVLLERADGAVRADAIAAALHHEQAELRFLGAQATGGVAWQTMAELARDQRNGPALRLAALKHLPPALVPRAIRVEVALSCVGRPDPALAALAARLLGAAAESGDARIEAILVGILERADAEVKLGAAEALGLMGTVRSVASLLELEAVGGALATGARRAVRAIQSRAEGAEAGALSLSVAGGDSGALSYPAAEEGALALIEPREG